MVVVAALFRPVSEKGIHVWLFLFGWVGSGRETIPPSKDCYLCNEEVYRPK